MSRFILISLAVIVAAWTVTNAAHDTENGDYSCNIDSSDDATYADVLVLGAGLAGVSAARTLEINGIKDYIVLEASDRVGGRVREYENTNIELGANYIQGIDVNYPELHPIWREWVACDEDGPEGEATPFPSAVYNSTGSPIDIEDTSGTYLSREEDYYDAFSTVEEEFKTAGEDVSVRDGLEDGGWEPQTPLDNFIEWYGFDYCETTRPEAASLVISVPVGIFNSKVYLGPEPDAEADDYLVTDEKGFSFVAWCLARDFRDDENRLKLNSTVTKIQWSNDSDCVCVTAMNYEGEEKVYCGRYAIVTFSMGVLQAAIEGDSTAPKFEPPLPQSKQEAINSVNIVHYGKLFLQFETAFWDVPEMQQVFGYISDTRGYFPLFTINRDLGNILFFEVTEDLALRVAEQPENETIAELMAILRKIYGDGIPDPIGIVINRWSLDPLFLGSYSSFAPGVSTDVFKELQTPAGPLYFAGEGCNSTYGFTHSAYGSGVFAAQQIVSAENSGEL